MRVAVRRMMYMLPLFSLGAFVGCGVSPPTQFYILSPFAEGSPIDVVAGDTYASPVVGVAAVKLPEYLNRPQIVARTSGNELVLADFDHWAGSLRENISSVLAANLAMFIPTDRIAVFPAKMHASTDYEVFVDLVRFEQDMLGQAVLVARWHIVAEKGRSVLFAKTSRYAEDITQEGVGGMVVALNRILNSLSREIGAEIASLWQSRR